MLQGEVLEQEQDSDEPVKKKRRGGGIKRFVGSPESTPGDKAFLGEFLVQACVGETDGEDVAEIAQGDKGGEAAGAGAVAEDVAEEEAGNYDFGFREVGFWNRGEVGDVCEDVEDCGAADGEGGGPGEGFTRVADFA